MDWWPRCSADGRQLGRTEHIIALSIAGTCEAVATELLKRLGAVEAFQKDECAPKGNKAQSGALAAHLGVSWHNRHLRESPEIIDQAGLVLRSDEAPLMTLYCKKPHHAQRGLSGATHSLRLPVLTPIYFANPSLSGPAGA